METEQGGRGSKRTAELFFKGRETQQGGWRVGAEGLRKDSIRPRVNVVSLPPPLLSLALVFSFFAAQYLFLRFSVVSNEEVNYAWRLLGIAAPSPPPPLSFFICFRPYISFSFRFLSPRVIGRHRQSTSVSKFKGTTFGVVSAVA